MNTRHKSPHYRLILQPANALVHLTLPRLLSCWERTAASHLDFTRRSVHAYISARLPPQTPHTLGFSRRRPVVPIHALTRLPQFVRKPRPFFTFQWASAASFAFSSAIVNERRMRPRSSRPLQYEDGVGGSQRGAPSSGTNTGNRRAGKRRHGKTPGVSRNTREQSRFAAVVRPQRVRGGRERQKRAAHPFDSGSWSNSGGQRDAVWRKTGVRDRLGRGGDS